MAVASVEVSPPAAEVGAGETIQLTAVARDGGGDVLMGRSVTWSSDREDVAIVSETGLVAGVGKGEATITASVEGQSGAADISVILLDFAPNSNTTLEGKRIFATFTIPAGVTVTGTGPLEITVEGPIGIEGDLIGGCVSVELTGGADVTINGDVMNGCAADLDLDDTPGIMIAGLGDLTIGPGVFESAGDIVIKNDATLTEGDFPAPAPNAAVTYGGGGPARATVNGTCNVTGRTFQKRPASRLPGSSGQFGGTGRNGRMHDIQCAGNLILNNTKFIGQHGGPGGDGTHQSSVLARAGGGNGGRGGNTRIRATGSITIQGGETLVQTGNGAPGGKATATGLQNPAPNRAVSAEAEGGGGGEPGLATVIAGGAIVTGLGAQLLIRIGSSGGGGDAIARGADGMSAAARGGSAQDGGHSTAVAGAGGSTPDLQLIGQGAVAANVDVEGGAPGAGGMATSTGGKGGDGDEPSPNGATGGDVNGTGGDGGDARLRDRMGNLLANGGDGGGAMLVGALGGNGWDDCVPGNLKKGGDGGGGGNAGGRAGNGGTGIQSGANPTLQAAGISIGGRGGNGQGPGAGGEPGSDNIVEEKDTPGSFQPGAGGNDCTSPPTAAEIPGTYALTGPKLADNCPAGLLPDQLNNPAVAILALGSAAPGDPARTHGGTHAFQINSNTSVTFIFNEETGAITGSGSGTFPSFSLLEQIIGTFRKYPDGLIELVGELIFNFSLSSGGTCIGRFDATYTQVPPLPG